MSKIEIRLPRQVLPNLKAAAAIVELSADEFVITAIRNAIREVDEKNCLRTEALNPTRVTSLRARGREARQNAGPWFKP